MTAPCSATPRSSSAPGEKVGLVGRNGTGKSTFISVVIDEPGRNVRSTGNAAIRGTYGYLPQVPVPHGLGLEPNGFSHVLSGRGLDVLDDALGKARTQMAKDPSTENIELFSDLEEQFRENGGYEAESTMARLADGLGLRQELLLEDIESLSGGQRRRVDLIRILFQGPGHHDPRRAHQPPRPAGQAVADGGAGERSPGPSWWSPTTSSCSTGRSTRCSTCPTAASTSSRAPTRPTWSSSRPTRASASGRALLEGREIKRLSTLADSMRGSTNRRARIAKSLDKRVERLESAKTEVHKREKKSSFRLPTPARSGEVPLRATDLVRPLRRPTPCWRTSTSTVAGATGWWSSAATAPASPASSAAWPGCRSRRRARSSSGANVTLGYFAQEHEQVDLGVTVLENIDDTVLVKETERRALLGSFGIAGKAAHQMPKTLSGGERAKLGLAMLAAGPGQRAAARRAHQQPRPVLHRGGRHHAQPWPGTIVVVSHDRAFVEALEPTHALKLPDEVFTHWRDDYLDQVEMK